MENKEPVIMRGSPVAEHMLSNLTWDPSTVLHIFANQEDPASAVYVRNKKKKCEEKSKYTYDPDYSYDDIEDKEEGE